MRKPMLAAIVATSALTLAACETRQPTTNTSTTTTTTESNSGVVRQDVTPEPTAAPAPVAAAIQTQPGPKGGSVALNKVAVVGDILTVALTYTGTECCSYAKVDEISVIDDATSQRISVLKDNAGNWMAAPMAGGGRQVQIGSSSGSGASQIWFKFPAPPATTKTVSITIPEVAPFDAVPVTR